MITHIFSTQSKDIPSKGERTADRGDLCVTREYSTEHRVYYASRGSPAEPWVVSLSPPGRIPWTEEAILLITALLEAGRHVWVKIQSPEEIATGERVAEGLCSTVQDGKPVEGRWTATTRTGEGWDIEYTGNPPESQFQPGITALIRAALKAAQTE